MFRKVQNNSLDNERFVMQKFHVNPFRIGCDPEFAVLRKAEPTLIYVGGVIFGSDDDNWDNGDDEDAIGDDHGGEVVELRPEPSYLVAEVLANIKKLLAYPLLKPLHEFVWRGGAHVKFNKFLHPEGTKCQRCSRETNICSCPDRQDRVFLGGHIHIELPAEGQHGVPREIYKERIEACDSVIRTLESLNILPQEECKTRRGDPHGYGRFGAVQNVDNDEDNFVRIEYRTPCSWLFSPEAALLTLTGVKLAATNPRMALATLAGSTDKRLFSNLVKFYDAFQYIDYDANLVSKKVLTSKRASVLEGLQGTHTENFRPKWEAARF